MSTSLLRSPLTGQVYLVGHGRVSLPSLSMSLQGEGVAVTLDGAINVSQNQTVTTAFRSLPDAPITSVSLSLSAGAHSLLAGSADLCSTPITLPYTLTAQDGGRLTHSARFKVAGCPKPRAPS